MTAAERNLALARKFYDGYHGSVARGRLEGVFLPEDFAATWTFCSPYLGGELRQPSDLDLAAGAVANHATIWARIPDYKMDHFDAWPTDWGCAWRWRVNGTGVDGRRYEFWEQLFTWADPDGKVTRFEFFDDWHGFPQTLSFAYGTPLDQLTGVASYGADPWVAPRPTVLAAPPAVTPADIADPGARRSLDLARRCFEGGASALELDRVGTALSDDLAERWVLFSPWFGEVERAKGSRPARSATDKIRQVMPDYGTDDFRAWPTSAGCAARWRVGGHTEDGTWYETWEQLFLRTDAAGRVVRVEIFDDWMGFPQTAGRTTGLEVDELWSVDAYEAWITQP